MIETRGSLHISDIKVNVAHDSARRHALPTFVRCRKQASQVQRCGACNNFTVANGPGTAIAVGVYLYAEPVRIDQIDCFTDGVIACAERDTQLPGMLDKTTESGPAGK